MAKNDYVLYCRGLNMEALAAELPAFWYEFMEGDKRTSTLFLIGVDEKYDRDFISLLKRHGSPCMAQVIPDTKDMQLRIFNLRHRAFTERGEAESRIGEGYSLSTEL